MVTTDQNGETDADPDHLRAQGARWRICRKHTGVPRSRIEISRSYARSYGEMTEKKRSVTVRQHFVLTNARCPLSPSPSLL